MNYEIVSSHDEDGAKVVEVVAEFEGAEGPTTELHKLTWWFHERYKVNSSGKQVPKTGTDYKQEIGEYLDTYYSPKETSPSQSEQT